MGNRLRQWAVRWGRLRRWRRDRRKRPITFVTALDLDGQILRVVQAGPRDRILRLAALPLELAADADRSDPVALGVAISRALAKAGIRPDTAVMGIPRARVILRSLTVPVIEKLAELASLVHLQVGKDLPFRSDEAVIDFKVRRQVFTPNERVDGAEKAEALAVAPRLEVLVATVKRDVVDFYLRLAEAAGFPLAALGLLPYANARCVEACHVADGDEAFTLVSLRPDEVGIDIISRHSLLFSRGAAVRPPAEGSPASAPGAVAEHLVQAAVIEVVRSLHAYAGLEANPPVSKIVVTGATGAEAEVVSRLSSRLSTPCTLLAPSDRLQLPADSIEAATGSTGAIGLAFGMADSQRLPFDFLNPKRPAIPRDMGRIRLLAGAATATVLLIGVLGLRAWLVQRKEKVLESVSLELADAEKKRPTYRRMTQQSASVDEWVKGGRDWLAHYAYLTSILPSSEEVYLNSMAVSGQGQIQLGVQARSGETLARLDKQLRSAGYDVKPLAINPGADRFGYEFRSAVELIVPDNLRIDLQKYKPPARPADDMSLEPAAYRRPGGGG